MEKSKTDVGKFVRESKNYRICVFTALEGEAYGFVHPMRSITYTWEIIQYAVLQKKCWFFGSYWKTVAMTNRNSDALGWIKNYFGESNA